MIFLYLRSNSLNKYIFNKSSILFFTLVIWSAITIFFSINSVESIVVLSQFFAIAIGFLVVLVCISEIDNGFKLISNIISLYLIVELISIYLPFARDIEIARSQIFSRSSLFLGFAANVNITAFSIIYKIPFFIYSIMQLKKIKYLLIVFPLIVFSLIIFASGTLNSTRGAILTYTLLAPILLTISLLIYIKSKQTKLLVISTTYILALLISFPINSFFSKSFRIRIKYC